MAFGREVWHLGGKCGIWEGSVAFGREVWHLGGRCGIWEGGVAFGREVWHLGGRCGIWEGGVGILSAGLGDTRACSHFEAAVWLLCSP